MSSALDRQRGEQRNTKKITSCVILDEEKQQFCESMANDDDDGMMMVDHELRVAEQSLHTLLTQRENSNTGRQVTDLK